MPVEVGVWGTAAAEAAGRLVSVLLRRGAERVGGVAGEYACGTPRREGPA